MNYNKYLPLGTVVILKGGKKRIMVTGYCSISKDNDKKIFDYSGCLYPEGVLSSDKTLLFDHTQIDKIYHLGYEDEEGKKFRSNLILAMNKINSNK